MFLYRHHTKGLSINSYIIGDLTSKRCAVIDPTLEVEPILKIALDEGYHITDILETHVHADFVSGAKELKDRLGGAAEIHASAMGGAEWVPAYADRKVQHGDEVSLGSIKLQARHTPGHTPEHLIWVCYDTASRAKDLPVMAFTGDLLFVGSVGRPDLLGKEKLDELAKQLYYSLFIELEKLPDFIEVYPAHGAGSLCGKNVSNRPSSTLGYERLSNPYLVKKPLEKWIEDLLFEMPAPPINFARLKKINVLGFVLPNGKVGKKEVTIDVRSPADFASSHIKGSYNIPYTLSFANNVSSIFAENLKINIVYEKKELAPDIERDLMLLGFGSVNQFILWNERSLKKSFSLEPSAIIEGKELEQKLKAHDPSVYLLDVRTPSEWNRGHIEGASHIEFANLEKEMKAIPLDADVFVYCGSGNRASVAASFLKKAGYRNITSVIGSVQKLFNMKK